MIDHPAEGTLLEDVVLGLHVNRLVPSHTGANADVLAARVLTEGGYVDSTDQVAFADAIVGPPGPQGVPGVSDIPGPQGEVGPQGPSGTAVGSARYRWKVGTANADPGHGFLTSNTADTALATLYFASTYDVDGRIVRFDMMDTMDEFTIYESDQFNTWNRYLTTGPVEILDNNEWFRIPCVFDASGSLPFTPGNNQAVEIQTPVKGEQGPQGIQGPTGPQGLPGQWVQMTQAAYDALTPKDPDTLYVIIN